MSNFSKVGTFMKTFGQDVKTKPSFSTDKINKLRIDLIKEELDELSEAMNNKISLAHMQIYIYLFHNPNYHIGAIM